MFVAQDDSAVVRLKEIESVHLADGFGRSSDCNKAQLSCCAENCVSVGRIERLNLIQEEGHSAIIAAQLIL